MSRRKASHDVFAAIADPTRRAILDALAEGELSSGELAGPHRMSLPAVSQHLAVLRDAGLVDSRQEGRSRVYRINPEPLMEVRDWMLRYRIFWAGKLDALGDALDEMERGEAKSNRSKRKGKRK